MQQILLALTLGFAALLARIVSTVTAIRVALIAFFNPQAGVSQATTNNIAGWRIFHGIAVTNWQIKLPAFVVLCVGITTLLSAQTTTFSGTGNWSDATKWSAGVPTSSTITVTIAASAVCTVDGTYSLDNSSVTLTLNGRLNITGSSTLTVGPSGGGNRLVTVANGGMLDISGGTFTINGNLVFNAGSTFSQTDGSLVLDGNTGTVASSVASGTSILRFANTGANNTMSGGSITLVDPHFATTATLSYAGTTSHTNASGTHTFIFGDGTSTTAGSTSAFNIVTLNSTIALAFRNVELRGPSGTDRFLNPSNSFGIDGALTINSGAELRLPSATTVHIAGNITNNGTATIAGTLTLGRFQSNAAAATTTAQTISGNGVWRNATSSPTANMLNFTVNNTNTNAVQIPAGMITGTGTGSVSGTLTLTAGKLAIGGSIFTLGTGTGTLGTLSPATPTSSSYIMGEFRRWIGTATGNQWFPVGTATTARFAQINFTTAQTTGGVIRVIFNNSVPSTTSLPITANAGNNNIAFNSVSPTGFWRVDRLSGAGGTYSATFDATGFTNASGAALTTSGVFLAKRTSGGAWGAGSDGTASAVSNLNAITRTGMTAFSDFALGINTATPAPTITSFSPTSGPIGTLVTITGTNLSNPTAPSIGGVAAITVSNNGTTLVAMVMPGATTGAVSVTNLGGTATGSGNFTVTPTPRPGVQQGGKLVGTGNTGAAQQGYSVAVSADGNTAIVGGRNDNTLQGAAWIYTRSGGVWTQQGSKLVGTGGSSDAQQGWSVALSADGNTAIVGGYKDNGDQGAAWIYTRSGGTWTQQGNKLVGADNTGTAQQGYSVALSADGNTAIVGGRFDNISQGAAWVYTRSGGVWTQQGSKLVGTGGSSDAQQGRSVALSADGNTAMVGGDIDNSQQGAAWVFTRSGGVWTQQGNKLVGTNAVGAARQGYSVALSADGNTAIVGGFTDNSLQGAAWVFTRSGGVWTQQGNKLVGTGALGTASQGISVALSADGNTAMVGGINDNSTQGAAWVYTRSGGVWTQQGSKLVGTGAVGAAQQGWSVALSADGNTAIVGGRNDNSGQGAAWVFVTQPPAPTITAFSPTSGPIGTLVTITGTNLSNPTTHPTATSIGGVAAISVSNDGTTLVAMVMPGATTGAVSVTNLGGTAIGSGNFTVTPTPRPGVQQGSKLVGTGNINAAQQGWSVAVSADGNTAIVGGRDDNTFQGAAWVYTRSGGVWTQQGNKLVGTGAVSSFVYQGYSVALSADGNTAIVGGYGDNSGQGAVWVYTRSGGVWTQQGNKLVGTGTAGNASQGTSVALSADGNTAIVGGNTDNTNQGAVWVFTRSGSTWTQQGNKLVGTGNIGAAYQGGSVALSADGNTAMVGGNVDNLTQGAAWVFTRSGGVWTQQGNKLVGTGAAGNASQGTSVALSADGNTAIVGGWGDNSQQGAVWVFTRSGNTWTQQGTKLVGTGNTGAAQQGRSIALSADGNTAMVGGPNDNSGQGAVWVFTRSSSAWTQQGTKLVGTGNTGAAQQGRSIALSADGNTAIVGGNADDTNQGAAWVFVQPPAPTITAFSPTSGPVGTLVTITGTNLNNLTALSIGGVAAISVSNNGTTLVAMVMPGATNGAVSVTTLGGTATGSGNFTVTPTPHPGVQQGGKLVGTDNTGAANQGYSVAVSADGNTAIVGGNRDNNFQGAAWIYTRSGGVWSQQGSKLIGTGNTGIAQQGVSVALSADGNTAMVGGHNDNSGQGAAWVYTRSGSTWTQQGNKLVGTDNTGAAQQGISVALSADGNTAIVGGYVDNSSQGAVWVFTRSGSTWTQQGTKLVGTGNTGAARQGRSVALSADGNTAIVGGSGDNSFQGAAWVYTRSGGVWTQQGNKLVGTGTAGNASQGTSVALSADGNTAIVGGNTDNTNQGAVWVFTRSGSTWTQQGTKLVGTSAAGAAQQGISVALSADGNTAIVGGWADNSQQGAVWVFTRSGNTWTQQGTKLVGTGSSSFSQQGTSVALSADGNTAIVGGYTDNTNQGAAWVFVPCTTPTITTAAGSNSPICAGQTLNLSVSASGTAPLSYAWAGTGTFTNGATATPTVTGAATGNYTVTVSNACGSATSTVA
ncbi:MAG TPA: IPT/TIG domain-containing protein, partial [Chitinophagales bacterium]|nr:IPT/TIG domain-containing protein [Chitinophagales bacterium]HRK29164.1 IPT/TIG domain-containing protein [Chitinophagales bacterium]